MLASGYTKVLLRVAGLNCCVGTSLLEQGFSNGQL